MKKITLLCLTLIFLLSFSTVKADGMDPTPTPSNIPETREYEQYSTDIEKKEVKSPNKKINKTIPVIVTIVVLGAVAGGVYFHKKRK